MVGVSVDAKDEIKRRLSVEDVVGDYIELKRAGRNFKGLSPFNSEKTASFMVSPEKQIWYDFSSNRGGDIFSFVMEVEGVDFRQSLEILAKKANVELSEYQKRGDGETSKLKKRLLLAHQEAVNFYHVCLSRQPDALAYIKDARGFTADTIRTWKLGYSPMDGLSLRQYLTKRGYSDNELEKAGLITRRRGSYSDMFRGRIMIPLADGQGNTVGFTSRILIDNDRSGPKYLNTPQTLIYDKGRQVFGLHHAKQAIRQQDVAVLVEGNLDVIASHQIGVCNVVAAAGTAMTADHLRSLSRLSYHVCLAFDADEAGLKATERAISIAQSIEIDLKVVQLPDGIKDPDELIQGDKNDWRDTIANAVDATTWTLQRYGSTYDKNTPEGKRQLSSKALAVIGGLRDPVEQETHLKMLSEQLEVSMQSLIKKMKQSKQRIQPKKETNAQQQEPDRRLDEQNLLALNAAYPDVRDSLRDINDSHFTLQKQKDVLEALKTMSPHKQLTDEQAVQLNLDPVYVNILLLTAEKDYSSMPPADITADAMALARRMIKKTKDATMKNLTLAIHEAEVKGDEESKIRLVEQYQQLLQKD